MLVKSGTRAVARAGSWSDVSGVSFFSLTFLAPQTAERPSPKIAESGEMLGGRTGGMPPRAAAGRARGFGGEQSIGGGWGLACGGRDVRAVRQG